MLLLRILNGAALASLKPLCVGLVADTTAETLRGRQYGYLELCVKLGMMAAALMLSSIESCGSKIPKSVVSCVWLFKATFYNPSSNRT